MALVICWYDFICLGIVAVAFCGAVYFIWRDEGAGRCGRGSGRTTYESLLIEGHSDSGYAATPSVGYVASFWLWASCWRGMHPAWLLGLRFVSFFATAAILAWDVLDCDASVFMYYTEWTFTLVSAYFAIGTLISAYGCWEYSKRPQNDVGNAFMGRDTEEYYFRSTTNANGSNGKDFRGAINGQEEIQHGAGVFGYLMQIMYQTCAGAVILTDIMFWCIIVPFLSDVHLSLNLLMGCMHTLNALFLLLDTGVNSLPFPLFRLSYFVLWSCIYVIFQWVIHACGFSWWPYPFLLLSEPYAPLWYLCLALAHVPCYGIYYLIVKAKIYIFSHLCPHEFMVC